MSKLNEPFILETTFDEYRLDEQIGEGGAGRVFGGTDSDGAKVAVKVLSQATADKRRRFKNEVAFLARNKHPNIVTVVDHGVAVGKVKGPFYVMRRYAGSLRDIMEKRLSPGEVMELFSQIINGVEAAHLQGVVHRDLKPENVLYDRSAKSLAVADFGVASFTEAELVTLVETGPNQRLANFQYAAPEQRARGSAVSAAADIYALGLILNEMFTAIVPHGTDYKSIGSVSRDWEFLDAIVAQMIKQNPSERPSSIAAIKQIILRYQDEAVSLQRLSRISDTVIRIGEIDDPLAIEPPVLVGAEWDNGQLRLTLNRPVSAEWVSALRNMGSQTSIMGSEPQRVEFRGATATVPAKESSAQMVVDYFKSWLPQASRVLKDQLEQNALREAAARREQLRLEREAEEQRLRVNRRLQV